MHGKPRDRRAGVVWHTQGGGESFTMLFFVARVIRESAMQNPTLAIIVEHFHTTVADKLDGKAKAMIVTSSRLHAVRYKLAVDAALKRWAALTRRWGPLPTW